MTAPFRIGLTGSIGMGKSTTAKFFSAHSDVNLWDADAAVHQIYAKGGTGAPAISTICPEAVVDGAVSRAVLKDWIGKDPSRIKMLETMVHPLVRDHRMAFETKSDAKILVFDIPLLFEGSQETEFDIVAVVSTSADEQRRRVLERPGMTEELFDLILSRQMLDADKRAQADIVIQTDTLDGAKSQVDGLLKRVREGYYA